MRRSLSLAAAATAAAALCSSPSAVAFQSPHSAPLTHRSSAASKFQHLSPRSDDHRVPLHRQTGGAADAGITSSTSLAALPAALASVASPLGSVSVLAFVVLIHEAGHFLAARSFGIKVDEFSVGVGPKLAGFNRKADDESDDEIEFSLRAIPLGGYVRFPENYNTTLAQINEDVARKQRIEYRKAKRAEFVAGSGVGGVAGDESRTAGLLSVLTFGFVGKKDREEAERLAKEEAERLEKEQQKKSRSWKNVFGLVSTNAAKADGTSSIEKPQPPPEIEYYDDPNLLQNRPWTQRAVVLAGGVVFNILLAFACYFGELSTTGLPQPVFREGALITQAPRVDGPSNGLLHKGDVIVGINGTWCCNIHAIVHYMYVLAVSLHFLPTEIFNVYSFHLSILSDFNRETFDDDQITKCDGESGGNQRIHLRDP